MRRTEAKESIIVYTCSFLAENRGNQVVIARGFTGEEIIHSTVALGRACD